MPRTPQKSAIPRDATDQAAETVPERTALHPTDHEAVFSVLDTPPAPTERLRTAFARHRETITSR
ncbi:DUF1778 domain-containing protein [Sphingomonas sp. H39-1-10]|uniref:type II toxin -antitoxin system TacA 1-like antitoxin n=1 Tax=Sphingomonas pollutisoli TaxID=3030829 RepID=UPI0023B8C01A|nr:DUF1778 domain-containing protein [Sphingomonas pollutisoli]MDF0490987.1 DUF1778 domain-containing protein [Sphingomonas pollutisoli]